jgi:hypothetical protein
MDLLSLLYFADDFGERACPDAVRMSVYIVLLLLGTVRQPQQQISNAVELSLLCFACRVVGKRVGKRVALFALLLARDGIAILLI